MTAADLHRDILHRASHAHCLGCQLAWSGVAALAAATKHARNSGHVTEGIWLAEYRYTPTGGAS